MPSFTWELLFTTLKLTGLVLDFHFSRTEDHNYIIVVKVVVDVLEGDHR